MYLDPVMFFRVISFAAAKKKRAKNKSRFCVERMLLYSRRGIALLSGAFRYVFSLEGGSAEGRKGVSLAARKSIKLKTASEKKVEEGKGW